MTEENKFMVALAISNKKNPKGVDDFNFYALGELGETEIQLDEAGKLAEPVEDVLQRLDAPTSDFNLSDHQPDN